MLLTASEIISSGAPCIRPRRGAAWRCRVPRPPRAPPPRPGCSRWCRPSPPFPSAFLLGSRLPLHCKIISFFYILFYLGTVGPDWICNESGTIGKPFKRTSTAIGFWFFNFDLEFLKKLQSSEPLHTKMHLILLYLLGSRVVWSQTAIFSAKTVFKNVGKSTIGLWITACE